MRGQLSHSYTMCKFKMKLLYNEEQCFWDKTELLNIKVTIALAKLDMVGSRLISNGLIFSGDNPVNIHLVAFIVIQC